MFGYGETIFSDDFEGYGLHDWPSVYWVADGNAESDQSKNRIELDPTGVQNQVFRLYGVENESYWAALTYHSCEFPNEFILYCRVYNGSEYILTSGHMDRAVIAMRNGTYWGNPCRRLITFNGNGKITGSGIELGTYQTERWYDVRTVSYTHLTLPTN